MRDAPDYPTCLQHCVSLPLLSWGRSFTNLSLSGLRGILDSWEDGHHQSSQLD